MRKTYFGVVLLAIKPATLAIVGIVLTALTLLPALAAAQLSAVSWISSNTADPACGSGVTSHRPTAALLPEYDSNGSNPIAANCDTPPFDRYCGTPQLAGEFFTDYLMCQEYRRDPTIPVPAGAPAPADSCQTIDAAVLASTTWHDLALGLRVPDVAGPFTVSVNEGPEPADVEVLGVRFVGEPPPQIRLVDYNAWTATVTASPGTRNLIVAFEGQLEVSGGGMTRVAFNPPPPVGGPTETWLWNVGARMLNVTLEYTVTFDETAVDPWGATRWESTNTSVTGIVGSTNFLSFSSVVPLNTTTPQDAAMAVATRAMDRVVEEVVDRLGRDSGDSLARFFGDFVFQVNPAVAGSDRSLRFVQALDGVEAPPSWNGSAAAECGLGDEQLGMAVVVTPLDRDLTKSPPPQVGIGEFHSYRLDDALAADLAASMGVSSWSNTPTLSFREAINVAAEPVDIFAPNTVAGIEDTLLEVLIGAANWLFEPEPSLVDCESPSEAVDEFCLAGCAFANDNIGLLAASYFDMDACESACEERAWDGVGAPADDPMEEVCEEQAAVRWVINIDAPVPAPGPSLCGLVTSFGTRGTQASALPAEAFFEQDQELGEVSLVTRDRVQLRTTVMADLQIFLVDAPRCPALPDYVEPDDVASWLPGFGYPWGAMLAIDLEGTLRVPASIDTRIPLSSEAMVEWNDETNALEGWLSMDEWVRWGVDESPDLGPNATAGLIDGLDPVLEDLGGLFSMSGADTRRTEVSLDVDLGNLVADASWGQTELLATGPLVGNTAPLLMTAMAAVLGITTTNFANLLNSLPIPIPPPIPGVAWSLSGGAVADLLRAFRVGAAFNPDLRMLDEASFVLASDNPDLWECTGVSQFTGTAATCPGNAPGLPAAIPFVMQSAQPVVEALLDNPPSWLLPAVQNQLAGLQLDTLGFELPHGLVMVLAGETFADDLTSAECSWGTPATGAYLGPDLSGCSGEPQTVVYALQRLTSTLGLAHLGWERRLGTLRTLADPHCATLNNGGLGGALDCSDGGSSPALVIEVQIAPDPTASNAEGFVWVFDPVTDPATWLPGRP